MMQSNRLGLLASALILILPPALRAAPVTGFEDIDYWIGSGTKSAAMVIQFNDGDTPTSIVWGFHWDSSATVETMLMSMASSLTLDGSPTANPAGDARLSMTFPFFSGLGYYLDGISYDQTGLAGFDPVTREQAGFDPETSNYWVLYLGATGTAWEANFTYSDFGISSVTLSDGAWYGMSYAVGDTNYSFAMPEAAPAPVPEPAVWVLAVTGLAVVGCRYAKRLYAC